MLVFVELDEIPLILGTPGFYFRDLLEQIVISKLGLPFTYGRPVTIISRENTVCPQYSRHFSQSGFGIHPMKGLGTRNHITGIVSKAGLIGKSG